VSDSGTIVLGWLTRLVAGFALVGLLAFDGISLVVANVQAADDAAAAASVAADSYQTTHDLRTALQAAREVVPATDVIEHFDVAPSGEVTVTVDRTPTTLWMHRLGATRKWAVVHQTGSGSPPS
jgi:hypothetical protein